MPLLREVRVLLLDDTVERPAIELRRATCSEVPDVIIGAIGLQSITFGARLVADVALHRSTS